VQLGKKENQMNLQDAYTDFILSREAKNATERSLSYYKFILTRIVDHLRVCDVQEVDSIKAFHIRLLLKDLKEQNMSGSYIHQHARVAKTFLKFLYQEGYIPQEIHFDMPKIASKHLRVLEVSEEIQSLLSHCKSVRDRLIILLFVDTGIRLNELCMLEWSDINLENGSLIVRHGKGKKFRVVGFGLKTRRFILKYKSSLGTERTQQEMPLIQTIHGKRFTVMGLRSALIRLKEESGIDFSAHALRRSFAKLSIKAGMNLIYLQSLMGHSDIETTRNYVQKLDNSEVLNAQKLHGTVDNYFRVSNSEIFAFPFLFFCLVLYA
jgi:integrase/recombinase XerD